MGVPDGQVALRGEFPHGGSVAVGGTKHNLATLFYGIAVVAAGDLEAGGETLDIPFEWSGMGFVEVVQVKNQLPLRRGKTPKLLR